MKLSEARAVCSDLLWREYDEQLYAKLQAEIVQRLVLASPQVSGLDNGTFLLDANGLTHLGGEGKFCRQVQKLINTAGFADMHIGIADTAFVAQIASKFKRSRHYIVPPATDREFLSALSLQHMPVSAEMKETLFRLGIKTIGQFLEIPVDEVQQRFGQEGLLALDLAGGIDKTQPQTVQAVEIYESALDLCYPVESLQQTQFILKSMLERICSKLKENGMVAEELLIAFFNDNDKFNERPLKLLRPSNNSKFLLEIIKLALEAAPLKREFTGLHIRVTQSSTENWQQNHIRVVEAHPPKLSVLRKPNQLQLDLESAVQQKNNQSELQKVAAVARLSSVSLFVQDAAEAKRDADKEMDDFSSVESSVGDISGMEGRGTRDDFSSSVELTSSEIARIKSSEILEEAFSVMNAPGEPKKSTKRVPRRKPNMLELASCSTLLDQSVLRDTTPALSADASELSPDAPVLSPDGSVLSADAPAPLKRKRVSKQRKTASAALKSVADSIKSETSLTAGEGVYSTQNGNDGSVLVQNEFFHEPHTTFALDKFSKSKADDLPEIGWSMEELNESGHDPFEPFSSDEISMKKYPGSALLYEQIGDFMEGQVLHLRPAQMDDLIQASAHDFTGEVETSSVQGVVQTLADDSESATSSAKILPDDSDSAASWLSLRTPGSRAELSSVSRADESAVGASEPRSFARPLPPGCTVLQSSSNKSFSSPSQRGAHASSLAVLPESTHFEERRSTNGSSTFVAEVNNDTQAEPLTLLLQRFVTRLGAKSVVRPVAVDQHLPEQSAQFLPLAEETAGVLPINVNFTNSAAGASALACGLILKKSPNPEPVLVEYQGKKPTSITYRGRWHKIKQLTEPERLSGLWWERPVRKSYYIALIEASYEPRLRGTRARAENRLPSSDTTLTSDSYLVLLVHDHNSNSWQLDGFFD